MWDASTRLDPVSRMKSYGARKLIALSIMVFSNVLGIRAMDDMAYPASITPIRTCSEGVTSMSPVAGQSGCLDTCFGTDFGGAAAGISGLRQCCPEEMCPLPPTSPSLIITCQPCRHPPVKNAADAVVPDSNPKIFGISGEVQEFELRTLRSSMSLTEYLKIVGQDPDVLEAQLLKRLPQGVQRPSPPPARPPPSSAISPPSSAISPPSTSPSSTAISPPSSAISSTSSTSAISSTSSTSATYSTSSTLPPSSAKASVTASSQLPCCAGWKLCAPEPMLDVCRGHPSALCIRQQERTRQDKRRCWKPVSKYSGSSLHKVLAVVQPVVRLVHQ
eukprot:jgi/Botrbrau1/11613/Bobra.0209s0004.1